LQNVTLLGTNKVLKRTGVLVVLERSTTKNLGDWLIIDLENFAEDKLVNWAVSELLHIPPKDATVSGGGDALGTWLTDSQPVYVIDGVVMRLLEESCLDGLNNTRGGTFTLIKERERTVIWTTDNDIRVLVIENHGAESRRGRESLLWRIGVVQIPNVRIERHPRGHLLEAKHGIRNTNSQIACCLWVPIDLSDSTSNRVRVLEDHHCLCWNALAWQLRLLTAEIFFEEIDLIVLLNSFLGTDNEVFCGLRETKSGVSVQLLLILSNICWLGVVELLRPT
jgi:hypothetical protein